MSEPDDHYAALDVAPDAGTQEIREAWRFRIAAFHPDRFRDAAQRERAQEITKRVNAAWHVLGDPARRSRYDARRRTAAPRPGAAGRPRPTAEPAGPPPRPRRELPCPTCASRCRVDDAGGAVVELACPACGARFPAMVGAYCLGRPRLQRRWLGLRYVAVFADATGGRRSVGFRSLPPELALTEGELFSVVFDARSGRPAYAIVHGTGLDMAWRVR